MSEWLEKFDGLSFWLGFLVACLVWFLVGRLRPVIARLREQMRARSSTSQHEKASLDEIRLGNDSLRMSQSWHLASALFSLDEILVPPRLLAPAMPPAVYEPLPSEDVTDWAIPYMPDWPEMASYYGAPWLDPVEALQGGANLVIIGQPGSGKTVALAYLARQFIRKTPELGQLEHLSPVLAHVADLVLPPPSPADPLSGLMPALASYVTSIPQKRLPGVIQAIFERGRALLLIDGLDELPPGELAQVTQFLESLLQKFSKLRVVVAAAPDHLGGLPRLGLRPVSIASWDAAQRALFITHWGDMWDRFIAEQVRTKGQATNTLLVLGWLLNNTQNLTPLELALKTWAAFAGDSLGPSPQAAIEAHLRRILIGQPYKNRQALEQLAGQIVLNMQAVLSYQQAENWLGGLDFAPIETEADTGQRPGRAVRARGALPDLLESGLLVKRTNDRVTILHPILTGYLAAAAGETQRAGQQILSQPAWTGRAIALNYLAMVDDQAFWLADMLEHQDFDLLERDLLLAGRWLRNAPDGLPWTSGALRRLAECVQNDGLPLSLRARALTAMVISNSQGVATLLRQLVTAPEPSMRLLAALGSGMLRDAKAIQDLIRLLNDRTPSVNRAAILALTAIGDKASLEAVASLLLTGSDDIRRSAAEALTNFPEEGYPTLEEGSALEDARVRRAAVYGLARIRQPWAISIIEKLHTQDDWWEVKDAASQMLQALQKENPRLPRPIPVLTQTGWLTAFAADRGMGVAPGEPAYQLLYRALNEGTEDQCQGALYFLTAQGDKEAILPLYQLYFSGTGDLREMTYTTLWFLATMGVDLPAPMQFGLH
jgi:HEAT repeat protein